MTDRSRGELAEEYFRAGYNCSQSVALAFADILPIGRDEIARLSSSFGGGMGRLREVCGALSAAFMVLGLLLGYDTPETGSVKAEHYARIQEFAKRFEAQNGAIVCREILQISVKRDLPTPEARTPEYYKKRPCPTIVNTTAQLLDDFLREMGVI